MPVPVPIISGVVLGSSATEFYRLANNDPKIRQVVITSMSFVNNDTADRFVTVYIIPTGGTASLATTKILVMLVPQKAIGVPPVDIRMNETILPGYSIQAFADAGAVVAFRANGTAYP
jgi:hypothetical protein